ncbi:TetR/AcrR family transcriptional regulator [Acinetobacter soli]|uniref:TetR/AcrR family transcriptional regulator n=1 Tax=Acinetobacter soli TaxID=487316 RepID=UPI000E6AC27A|nr:TetR/AcrR family transcriptional regulator [Acinetobacter soli]
MSKAQDILSTAERLFDYQGFHATGIDQIVREAQVTPRTLYRHFHSKEHLILKVLEEREFRFFKKLCESIENKANSTPDWIAIFHELENWFTEESDRGCLFLRALAEYRHKENEIVQTVLIHKQRTLDFLMDQFAKTSSDHFKDKAESLMLIVEGAVALAPVIGGKTAIQRASKLAQQVLQQPIHPLFH